MTKESRATEYVRETMEKNHVGNVIRWYAIITRHGLLYLRLVKSIGGDKYR